MPPKPAHGLRAAPFIALRARPAGVSRLPPKRAPARFPGPLLAQVEAAIDVDGLTRDIAVARQHNRYLGDFFRRA